MNVRLRALGGLAVLVDGREHQELGSRPVQLALLLYLALEREASRDRVLALLWPESDRDHARQALRQTLYALRQDLGEDWLESEHDTLRATAALGADVADLMQAAEATDAARVAELYGGAFLDDVHLAESQPFQFWCDQWRARLERLNRRARRALIEAHVVAGEPEVALAEAHRWLELDPLEDEAWHRVLELLSRLGRGDEALREYSAYAALLAREGLEPLEETRALVAGMRGSAGSWPRLPPTPAPAEGAGARAGTSVGRAEGGAEPEVAAGLTPLPGGSSAPVTAAMASAADPPPPAGRPGWRWRVVLLAAGILLVAGTVGAFLHYRTGAGPQLEATRVLVLPLTNMTGDSTVADIGPLAAEWITHAVAHLGPLTAVPSEDVLQMLAAGVSVRAAARTRRAGTLISGRFFRAGDSLELRVQIEDLQRGELWDALAPIRLAPGAPEAGLRQLTDRVTGSLSVRFIRGTPLPRPSLVQPPSYPAFQALLDAAEFIRRGDWAGSLPDLERVVRLDTTFYRGSLYLASALDNTGQLEREDSLLHALAGSLDRMSDYERLIYQVSVARLRGDWSAVVPLVREAARLDPGGSMHYASAAFALAAGQPKAALEMYATLDLRIPWAPRIVFPSADWTGALHLLGRHRAELRDAERARRLFPDRLEPLFLELRALAALGRPDDVRQGLRQAAAMPSEGYWDNGRLLCRTAAELRAHGQPAAAEVVADSALAWYRARPVPERASVGYRVSLVDALLLAGDLAEATPVVDSLRGERPKSVAVLGRAGVLAARLGQRGAVEEAVQALEAARKPYQYGSVSYWRAAIAAWSGNAGEAAGLLRRSLEEGHRRGLSLHADPYLQPIWNLPAFARAVSAEQ